MASPPARIPSGKSVQLSFSHLLTVSSRYMQRSTLIYRGRLKTCQVRTLLSTPICPLCNPLSLCPPLSLLAAHSTPFSTPASLPGLSSMHLCGCREGEGATQQIWQVSLLARMSYALKTVVLRRKMPSGPAGLPFIGNRHQYLPSNHGESLEQLNKRYGK